MIFLCFSLLSQFQNVFQKYKNKAPLLYHLYAKGHKCFPLGRYSLFVSSHVVSINPDNFIPQHKFGWDTVDVLYCLFELSSYIILRQVPYSSRVIAESMLHFFLYVIIISSSSKLLMY